MKWSPYIISKNVFQRLLSVNSRKVALCKEVAYFRIFWNCLFWNTNDSIVKLMFSIVSGVSLRCRPCYKNMLNHDNDDIAKTFNNIKVAFLWLQNRYWLSLLALIYLEKLGTCLQISNELHNNVLRYR